MLRYFRATCAGWIDKFVKKIKWLKFTWCIFFIKLERFTDFIFSSSNERFETLRKEGSRTRLNAENATKMIPMIERCRLEIHESVRMRYSYTLLRTYLVHSFSMHLGESAAYYVNLASRSSFHLRLFQEWFLDDIYCFKLAHRFLSPI